MHGVWKGKEYLIMDALVTAVFRANNMCDKEDIRPGESFESVVRGLIESEGLIGVADLIGIIKIEQIIPSEERA